MSKRKEGQPRGKYTLEFKLEAVRLVKGGQAAAVTAKAAGHPEADAVELSKAARAQKPSATLILENLLHVQNLHPSESGRARLDTSLA